MTRRFPWATDESTVFAEAPFAGVSAGQNAILDVAPLHAGVKLLPGRKPVWIVGGWMEVEVADLRNAEHGAIQRSQAGGDRSGRGGVLERISRRTWSATKGAESWASLG